jgi:peroxiredoxin
MNEVLIAVLSVAGLGVGLGSWLGWQLFRQNGRMLLRLDELEKRLDKLEFGGADEPNERPDELQGRARHSVRAEAEYENNGAQGTDAAYPNDRATRFSNRSLTRSKIKRDGLKAGTSAPSFRLPRLDGGELSLGELRGKRVLLVFSDPNCGPCQMVAPKLEEFHREHAEISIVMISRGEPKENRAKVKEHGLTFPVVLQQQWEISRRYAIFATPVGYALNEEGVIAHDVAVGVNSILALLVSAAAQNGEKNLTSFALQSATQP